MKIGLLPLYIDIYDISSPHVRPRMKAFYESIAADFESRGAQVVRTVDFCRIRPEFEAAVRTFEEAGADAIVTLHMAYSPSLESIDALTATSLPIVVLDTTETLNFDNTQSPSEIMYNHGIHGVMDLCSMLRRRGRPYAIAAGHRALADVIGEAMGLVRAAIAARALGKMRVGVFGGAFESMGDFMVDPAELRERFGIDTESLEPRVIDDCAKRISPAEIDAELALDRERFDFPTDIDMDGYRRSLAEGLGLRSCLNERGLTAFSVNFRKVEHIPFIECCKAMERGTGYAGEGDGLTSAFVGAFLQAWSETNFVEIFCPDWEKGLLFLSHMGELNYRIADTRPRIAHKGGFVDTYSAYARMKGGRGVYVNISRGPRDYQLALAPAEIVSCSEDSFESSMRGWMRPDTGDTAGFLKELSRHGATHHSAFIYGASAEELEYFGALLGMETVTLR